MSKRKHQEVEDGDDEVASQAKKRGSQSQEDEFSDSGEEADIAGDWGCGAGMIEYVKMKNFMCHAQFVYKPTSKINFLSGANGSGKSAILAALIFGLGGTAKLSNRGSTNKNFIRTGQSQASVEISLYNRGDNSYRPTKYGKSIIIQRTVLSSGGGSYKLKNEKGKVVLDKRVKEELERILLTFNIQLDNPIQLLNQDTAKTFLFKCNPKDLYTFFMRATQLEDCERIYKESYMKLGKAETELEMKAKIVDKMKDERDKWGKKLQQHKDIEDRKGNLEEMRKECAWAKVIELEDKVKAEARLVETNAAKLSTCKESLDKAAGDKLALKHEKERIEAEVQQMENVNEERQKKVSDLRTRMRQVGADCKKLQQAKDDLERQRNAKQAQVTSMKEMIGKLRSTDTSDEARKREEREDAIACLEEDKSTWEARLTTTQTHIGNLKHTLETANQRGREITAEVQATKSNLTALQRQKKQIQDQGENRLVLFGENMPRIVADLHKNKGKFKSFPIGPLGMEIQLKPNVSKQKAMLIEHEIGGYLNAFIVDNFDDRTTLSQIVKRHRGKSGGSINIIVSKYMSHVHDVSRGRCATDKYPTILDLLEISNPNVINCLIDHKNIEKILLMDRDAAAQDMLSSVKRVPQNLKYAYTGEMNQFYPAPMYRSYALPHSKTKGNILQTSMTDHLAYIETEIADLAKTLRDHQEMQKAHYEDTKRTDFELKEGNKLCQEATRSISSLTNEIFRLKQLQNDDRPPDMEALEDDAERIEEDVQNITKEQAKLEDGIKEEKDKINALKQEHTAIVNEMEDGGVGEELRKKLGKCDKKLDSKEAEVYQFENKVSKYRNAANQLKERLQTAKAERDEVKQKVEVKYGTIRVETNRSSQRIQREIQALEEHFRRQVADLDPRELVEREFKKINEFYTEKREQVKVTGILVKELSYITEERVKFYKELRGFMSRRVKVSFSEHMSKRHFNGLLKFDHKKDEGKDKPGKTLAIEICPEEDEFMSTKRDMKTFSGGEKSYSTVSLVLALWECIEPPFRILDEFDVFMDMVNRRTALNMMIKYAQEQKRFQYVFLTPLTLNSLEKSDDVNIIHLQKTDGS